MVKAAQEGATAADKNTYRVFTTPLDHVQFLKELARLAALTGPEKLLPGTVITYTPMMMAKQIKTQILKSTSHLVIRKHLESINNGKYSRTIC